MKKIKQFIIYLILMEGGPIISKINFQVLGMYIQTGEKGKLYDQGIKYLF